MVTPIPKERFEVAWLKKTWGCSFGLSNLIQCFSNLCSVLIKLITLALTLFYRFYDRAIASTAT